MNKNFKRAIIIATLAILIVSVAVPSTAHYTAKPNVKAVEVLGSVNANNFVTKTYQDDMKLFNKQDESDVKLAQSFDDAKDSADKVASDVEVKPVEALTKDEEPAKTTKTTTSDSNKKTTKPVVTMSSNPNYLLQIANPDASYKGCTISLTSYDRDILERLVMGEAGAEGYIGCALVAQTIRDTMVNCGYTSVEAVRTNCGYYGSLNKTPNADVKKAVAFIFDQGGSAVQHDMLYFYAPNLCTSGFHESQEFVVQYGSHRFFDSW